METQTYNLKNTLSDNRLVGLWRMMIGHRTLYIIATISIGLAALSQTGLYYLLRYFVDNVLGQEDATSRLPLVAFGFIGLALVQGVFTFVSGRLAAKTAEGVVQRLRDYLYDHIQHLHFTYHDKMQTGELLQRATSDVDTIRKVFAEQAIGIGRISLLFWVNFIGLLTLNVSLALYSVIAIPLVILSSLYFFRLVGQAYEAYQEQDGKLSNTLQENLAGVRVVKAFARQAYEVDKIEVENHKKLQLGQRLILLHSLFWPVTDILCGAQMLAGFYLAARMVLAGDITIGTYLAYHGMVVLIIWPIRNLGRLITQMSEGLVSYGRVTHILRETREPIDEGTYIPTDTIRGHIHYRHVNFAYDPTLPVLQDVSFEVQPGQVVALLGATGAGKTSLVNLLPRFYEYSEGQITIDGVELRDYPRSFLRQHIGIVQQEPFLFSRTIRDNITYGVPREVTQAEIEAAATAAAVHDVILTFPNGYDTLVGERGVTLSGGQKQRLTLARTLLKNPRILILDDATSSVDTETEALIRSALQQLMAARTTFIIAHRIQSVMHADLILVLENGRIIQQGTHADLIIEAGIYRQVYELQSRIEDEMEEALQEEDVRNGRYGMDLTLAIGD